MQGLPLILPIRSLTGTILSLLSFVTALAQLTADRENGTLTAKQQAHLQSTLDALAIAPQSWVTEADSVYAILATLR